MKPWSDLAQKTRIYFTRCIRAFPAKICPCGFSVMFWGCFSRVGLGTLVAIDQTMKQYSYLEILNDYLIPEIEAAGVPMVFMQDNSPCYASYGDPYGFYFIL